MKENRKKTIIIYDGKAAYGSYLKNFIKNTDKECSDAIIYYSHTKYFDTNSLRKDVLIVLIIFNQDELGLFNSLYSSGYKNILVCSDVYDYSILLNKKTMSFVSLKQLKAAWVNEINSWIQNFNSPKLNSFSFNLYNALVN